MDMVLFLAESDDPEIHVIFRRSEEAALSQVKTNEAYITFYTPRMGASSQDWRPITSAFPTHQDQPLSPHGRPAAGGGV